MNSSGLRDTPDDAPPRVLIVDDDAPSRDTLVALLSPGGYSLSSASSGAEGLTVAAAIVPDLVLLDAMMPALDGFEVCRTLRADPHLATVPVLMVTALDDVKSRVRGMQCGADDVITKPVNGTELRARVATIVQLNRLRRLAAARGRFEWVIERSDDGFVMLDSEGALLFANAAARTWLEIHGELPTGARFGDLARRAYHVEPADALDQNARPRGGFLIRRPSPLAPELWLAMEVLPASPAEEYAHLVRLRDATARVAQSRDMWTFQGLISHKLRTPLGVLVGGLSLLSRKVGDDFAHAAELKLALQGAERLKESVLDVLAYIETSAQAPGDETCPVSELAGLVAEEAAAMGLGPVDVTVAPDDAEQAVVVAAPVLAQIIRELLENAKKFHPRQAPRVVVGVARIGDGMVRISVSDDGRSLPVEWLDQGWSPYFQGERRFTGEVPGMGLGLAGVALVVWRAGGRCRMRNRSGGPGIVVEIDLPTAREDGPGRA